MSRASDRLEGLRIQLQPAMAWLGAWLLAVGLCLPQAARGVDAEDDLVLGALRVLTTSGEAAEDDDMVLLGGINLGILFDGEDDDVTSSGGVSGGLLVEVDDGVFLEIRWTVDGIELSWPVSEGLFGVEATPGFGPVAWLDLTDIDIEEDLPGGRYVIRLPVTGSARYFRLVR